MFWRHILINVESSDMHGNLSKMGNIYEHTYASLNPLRKCGFEMGWTQSRNEWLLIICKKKDVQNNVQYYFSSLYNTIHLSILFWELDTQVLLTHFLFKHTYFVGICRKPFTTQAPKSINKIFCKIPH